MRRPRPGADFTEAQEIRMRRLGSDKTHHECLADAAAGRCRAYHIPLRPALYGPLWEEVRLKHLEQDTRTPEAFLPLIFVFSPRYREVAGKFLCSHPARDDKPDIAQGTPR